MGQILVGVLQDLKVKVKVKEECMSQDEPGYRVSLNTNEN